MAILGQEGPPELDVPVLDRGQLLIQLGLTPIRLEPGQLPIQVGRVSFVFEVVEPGGGRGLGHWGKVGGWANRR